MDTLTADHKDLLTRLDDVPGIDKKSAQSIVSEIGITLNEFKNMEALASWAGLCPGNNESAGKRKSGRTSVRKHPLKTILIEVSWAAVKKKGSYYRAKYFKLKSRRGAKKAIVAIAHRISKAIYNIIKHGDKFMDLGEEYLSVKSLRVVKRSLMLLRNRQVGLDMI
jgi:transposase